MIQKKERKKDIIQKLNERIMLLEDEYAEARGSYIKIEKKYKELEHEYNELADNYSTLSDMYHEEIRKHSGDKFRGYRTESRVGLSPEEINMYASCFSNNFISSDTLTDIITEKRTAPSHGDIYYKKWYI
jgi:predicted nuclease with TOPRIM domain